MFPVHADPENSRQHAIERARERCGLSLSLSDYEALNLQICRSQSRLVARESGYRKVHEVRHGGAMVLAVFSKRLHMIVTFLGAGGNPQKAQVDRRR